MKRELTVEEIAARNELILKLWNLGVTGSKIMQDLNLPSRCVVHGVISRMRARGRVTRPLIVFEAKPKKRETEEHLVHRLYGKAPVKEFVPTELPPAPWSGPPVSILDLKHNHCRFITGHDKLALYCGAPVKKGRSYCPHHCEIMFVPAKDRPKLRVRV